MGRIGVIVDGEFSKEYVVKTCKESAGGKQLIYPSELELPFKGGIALELPQGDEARTPYLRVFEIVNRSDELLLFTRDQEKGVSYAALQKAKGYGTPVRVYGG